MVVWACSLSVALYDHFALHVPFFSSVITCRRSGRAGIQEVSPETKSRPEKRFLISFESRLHYSKPRYLREESRLILHTHFRARSKASCVSQLRVTLWLVWSLVWWVDWVISFEQWLDTDTVTFTHLGQGKMMISPIFQKLTKQYNNEPKTNQNEWQ